MLNPVILSVGVAAMAVFYYFQSRNASVPFQIEKILLQSFKDYKKNGWPYDVYGPISHSHRNMPRSGQPLGWIIVDTIDTLMLGYNYTTNKSNKKEFLEQIQFVENWVENDLDYNMDSEVNIFETTIRMLGGLLSGYYLSTDLNIGNPEVYLNKAIDLADRLSLSFANSPSGIPYSSVNLRTGEAIKNHVDNGASSTAEFTTLQLEFKYLASITGNKTYWKLAEQVYEPLYKVNNILEQYDGLVPIYTLPDTAQFWGRNIRFGSRGDSFYEYLLKQYLLTHEGIYYDLYRAAINGMKKHLVKESFPSGLTYIAEKPNGLEYQASSKMDHLVCFMGGLLAMGATEGHTIKTARNMNFWDEDREDDWLLAMKLTHTCYQMYHQLPAGLSPEIVVFNYPEEQRNEFEEITQLDRQNWWNSPSGDFFVKPLDGHNLQRPETVESIMFMYHLSNDTTYREWGEEILNNFAEHTAIKGNGIVEAYTSLNDCLHVPTGKKDNMESFWLAETLKYLYLLFQDDIDLTEIVFNTEAHPFPVLEIADMEKSNLTTGWGLK
ncbi:similar to Saccharomyces cerevisiae YJR131W MNS1 Alpha-1,2-mannosidase involved in ER quality control [Maudiozyma saulgeensis]|uniref:alpha-1,2-Mannosidase n=1 Tax=Maudiozyma saulgeensis TaxID=1789683 RepID=A0A1X7R8Q9_9SACH|nr:similar to Saccharomyces cerevisiae YJR131W MNS1 Alpha-1,2-mannosidase involved in ER quality control [Kazachstania saulgeensis]